MDAARLKDCKFANEEERTKALEALYAEDMEEYVRQGGGAGPFAFDGNDQLKFLGECLEPAAKPDDCFFQDLWAAREIHRAGVKHVHDLGSRFDGLIAHLLAMDVRVTMLDIRPFDCRVEGIDYIQTDAMEMDNVPDNSIETLSAICSLEHFGLGRYGDPIDFDGWKKAIRAIKRKLAVGGTFYMSVPVGDERVRFHAYRIFHPRTIVDEMAPELVLREFSFVDTPNCRIETCFQGSDSGDVDWDAVMRDKIGHERTGLFVFRKA